MPAADCWVAWRNFWLVREDFSFRRTTCYIKKLLPAPDEIVDEGLIAMSEVDVTRYVHQEGVRSPAS